MTRPMTAEQVLSILRLLDTAELDAWVDGGWGVDALHGQQTRDHKDLDLGVARSDLERTIEVLGTLQYAISDDRFRLVTVQLLDVDRNKIDLHPSDRLPDGGSEQIGFDDLPHYIPPPVRGRIGGEAVRCMPVDCQIRVHAGQVHHPEEVDGQVTSAEGWPSAARTAPSTAVGRRPMDFMGRRRCTWRTSAMMPIVP